MQLRLSSSLALLTLITPITYAATPIDGWYMSAQGGYAFFPGNLSKTTPSGTTYNRAVYQSGFDAGGTFGYQSRPLRYEAEISYFSDNISYYHVNGVRQTGPNGFSNAIAAMVNVFYDFPALVACPIQPFLGLGIGYAGVHLNLNATGPFGANHFSTTDSAFAYQGWVGLTYNFAENYALNIDYRYLATNNIFNLGSRFQAQTANVGAIYRFDGARYQ